MKIWISVLILAALARAHTGEDDDTDAQVEDVGADEVVKVEQVVLDDILYTSPDSHPEYYFSEHFDDVSVLGDKWIKSQAKAEDGKSLKYGGEWSIEPLNTDPLKGDNGLVLKTKAKHAAISAKLRKPFKFNEKMLVVQYEIAFQNGQDCGGGYIKLLRDAPKLDLRQINDKTPYSIMFGPDKCGSDSKLHFIFQHQNPLNKEFEEKHCKKVEGRTRATFEEVFKDKKPHLFRLIVRPDNTFEVLVDSVLVNHGTLLDSFTPAVNPPAEIDDPNDKKPSDWDEREKIPDPEAVKPDEWDEDAPRMILDESAVKPEGWLDDEPDMIPDPEAEKPADWDTEMDGDWEAGLIENPACSSAPGCGVWNRPSIENPEYKGKWYPSMINNPNYKGKWKPNKIPNPEYFNDEEPYKMSTIGAIAIELWSMSDSIYFDNLLITDSLVLADAFLEDTFHLKLSKIDSATGGMFKRLLDYSNKNPWLYAVYVVLVGLPLVLIITFCCSGGADKKDGGKSALNDPKKTDAMQEDDPAEQEEEEEEDEEGEEEQEEDGAEEDAEAEVRVTRSSPRKRRPRLD
ncbi:calnexin isoform X2 [Eurytemora carolleeae]|nr:calnexin isoform X2 [Eurytemora carolleeae]|eukprot:XP_023327144.1 calnexin-like isoform X2 [Eurytemora affinis]